MKGFLLVLAASAALSAWGQEGVEAPHLPNMAGPNSSFSVSGRNFSQAIIAQSPGVKLQKHWLEWKQSQAFVPAPETVDLENRVRSQAACPVEIADASFDRPAALILTAKSPTESAPRLRLQYRNVSGKEIESVVLTGWIKVKENPYQLDSVTKEFDLTLARRALLGKDVQATQALKLASNAIGFDRVEVSIVNYADGTSWRPKARSCVYLNFGMTERAEAR